MVEATFKLRAALARPAWLGQGLAGFVPDESHGEPKDHASVPADCQAFLVIDAGAPDAGPEQLAEVLRRQSVASVLLRGAPTREQVAACQGQGAAALVEGDARLALELAADGVHLPHNDDAEAAVLAYREARALLGAGRIVGASAGLVRHNAMELGELGADYVGFELTADEAAGLELVAWWAEMFVVPCVAFSATSPEQAARLAEAGADFVAAGPQGGVAGAIGVLASIGVPQGAKS